jgi:hypothetical protein
MTEPTDAQRLARAIASMRDASVEAFNEASRAYRALLLEIIDKKPDANAFREEFNAEAETLGVPAWSKQTTASVLSYRERVPV